MKKKLLDRRGAAIELAIMMMVFSIFITTIVLTTALLQNSHKAKAELGIRQDILLEQLGEDFVDAVIGEEDMSRWLPKYEGVTITHDTAQTHSYESGVCTVCGTAVPTPTEPKDGFSLTVMTAGKDAYKLQVNKIDEEDTPATEEVCGAVMLKITLAWSETDNAYKIIEWSKK